MLNKKFKLDNHISSVILINLENSLHLEDTTGRKILKYEILKYENMKY